MQKNTLPNEPNFFLVQALERLKEIIMSHFVQSIATLLLHHLISVHTN